MKIIYFFSHFIFFLSNITFAQGPQWIVYNTSNSGIPSNTLYSVEIDSNNIKWITSTEGLIKFDGSNWVLYNNINSPINNRCLDIVADKKNGIWFSVQSQGLFNFENGNFRIYNSTNSGLPFNNILGLAIEKDSIKWMGAGSRMTRFDNNSWTVFDTTNSGYKNDAVLCIEITDSTKWFGSGFNGVGKYDNHNWTYYTPKNSGMQDYRIWSISIENPNVIWIGTEFKGVHKYEIIPNQWIYYNTENSPIIDNYIVSILKNSFDGNLYIGPGVYGVVKMINGNWTHFGSPLPAGSYVKKFKRDKQNNIWMTTNNGLFVYNPMGVVKIEDENTLIRDFQLNQNYPNPFNPLTRINYELQIANYVTLSVYDINGRLVKELVNQKQSAGNYSIDFDGSGLPSGTYIYRLQAGDFSETKKMVLLK